MARAWRIEYEGALYHVLSRGNQRQAIFLDDKDRGRFLETIGVPAPQLRWLGAPVLPRSRGIEQRSIFKDDSDRERSLRNSVKFWPAP